MRHAALAIILTVELLGASRARAYDLLADAAAADAALEDGVGRLAVHGLLGDADAVAADVTALDAQDERRRARGRPPTGLADDARYLAAALAPTRDTSRAALKALLDGHADPVVQRLVEHRLAADDAATADQLLADDRHNRRAAIVNDAVRPLGVFSGAVVAAALNPFLLAGSAVDSIVTTAVNLWNYNRLTTPEREALARYRALLEREPKTTDAPEIARAIRHLGAKRAAALCAETVSLGTKALDDDDLDHATFYLRSARALDDCADRAAKPTAALASALAARATREDAALWPVDDPPRAADDEEARDYETVLVATAEADPGAMIEAAGRFRERHPKSRFRTSAGYALAAARDLGGHHEAARAALVEVADEDHSGAARAAAARLASPDFGRLDAIGDAERRHARDTARYVLLGGGTDGRTALYSALNLGAQGAQAAQSLGVVNVIGILTRAWQAWRRDPVSNQTIIDRGEEFLAREPTSAEVPAVHARLTDAYERAGAYGRALMHYRATTSPDPARIATLEGKIADGLLADAERDGGDPILLEGITRHFGATKAAEKARERLLERRPEEDVVLSRDVLQENPALLGPDALDLDPRLLDGDAANGELADAGVTLVAPGELRLALRDSSGSSEHTDTRSLAPEAYARARAAAQETLYTRLLTADRRNPETGVLERYIPFFLQGTVGTDGDVAVYPGVKMRRYQSENRQLYE